MKFTVALLALVALASSAPEVENTAYGYFRRYGIPTAEKIRQAEELQSRVVGGAPASAGQYPWQVSGLLIELVGHDAVGVCGASLVTASHLLTAAHCWSDGDLQAWRFTVVLGSLTIFTGGTRIETSSVAVHPDWYPFWIRNDIAVIFLPNAVPLSNFISPVSLPTGSELNENFAGESALASGYGLTSQGGTISGNQVLSHVRLQVLANGDCEWAFPLFIQPTNVCTNGVGGVGICSGDSGGPLVVTRNNRNILIGVTSFNSGFGCAAGFPSAYTRVTSFMNFINQHI